MANPTVRRVRRLRKRAWRERNGSFLVEGHRAVSAALAAGRIREVFHAPRAERLRPEILAAARDAGWKATAVSDGVMAHWTSATTAPDLMAVATMREAAPSAFDTGCALLLSGIRDPATAGGMMALAAAVGCGAVAAGPGTVDLYDPKTVRAAGGAHFLLEVFRGAPADAVKRAHARGTVVLIDERGVAPWSLALGRTALFIVGAPPADTQVDAVGGPPPGPVAPSMVATAASVLYEWVRQGER